MSIGDVIVMLVKVAVIAMDITVTVTILKIWRNKRK